MESDEFLNLCDASIESVRTFADIVSSAISDPQPSSTAWREYFASTEVDALGERWGAEVPRLANSVAAIARMGASQYLAALGQLLKPGQPVAAFGFEAIARCVIEASARAWWIDDPAIGVRQRVARAQTVYLHSLAEGIKAEALAGRGTNDFLTARDVLIRNVSDLGLRADYSSHASPRPIGFDGERRPEGTAIIRDLLNWLGLGNAALLAYPLYSAVAHVTSYGLTRSLKVTPNRGSTVTVQPQVTTAEVGNAVVFAVSAYLGAMTRWAQLFGGDWSGLQSKRFVVCGDILQAVASS